LIGGSLLVLLAVLGVWKFVLWASNPEETTNGGGVIESAEEAPPPTEKGPPQNPKKAGEPWEGPLGMRFRFVPPGTYTVGSPADEPGRYHWEWPRHQLQIAPGFWIAETEVTQEQWEAMGLINPSLFQNCGSDCPVEQVNWFEAAQYANLLSDREGLGVCYDLHGCDGKLGKDFACISAVVLGPDCEGFRLPTEVEWEVAARAGTKTPIHSGKLTLVGNRNAPELNPIAWYGGNSSVAYEGGNKCSMWPEMQFPARYCGTHPVRKKQGNSWELYDMLGNVWEWCTDWYGPYDGNVHISPLGPGRGSFRVFRGGSWLHNARYVRAAYRSHASPSSRYSYLGFRLARGQVLSEEAEPTGQ
jgi:formylglycine-generating enzyme required for sulfatase activity